MSKPPHLQVAVGVLKDPQGRILVALRQTHQHQGGLWEFPGGKIKASETVFEALQRELWEELALHVHTGSPLITIRHAYADLSVQLNVYRVDAYSGIAQGMEGQALRWVEPDKLGALAFPAANVPIITAACLPDWYAILDSETLVTAFLPGADVKAGHDCFGDALVTHLINNLQALLAQGITLIQARLKNLSVADLQQFKQQTLPLCAAHHATLLFNSAMPGAWQQSSLHLTSRDLMALTKRPAGLRWLAASCHDLQQLHHAQAIGVDFAVLAPVLPTLTHPQVPTLGWAHFAQLLTQVNMPVYALGGMQRSDLQLAKCQGAQGVAGIRLFLDE